MAVALPRFGLKAQDHGPCRAKLCKPSAFMKAPKRDQTHPEVIFVPKEDFNTHRRAQRHGIRPRRGARTRPCVHHACAVGRIFGPSFDRRIVDSYRALSAGAKVGMQGPGAAAQEVHMALRRDSRKVRSLASGARGTRGARPRLGGDACSTTYRGKELKESEEERDEERGGHGASEGVSLSSAALSLSTWSLRCRRCRRPPSPETRRARRPRRLPKTAAPPSGLGLIAQREQHPGVQKAVRDREAPPSLRTLRHELHFLSRSLSLSIL